MTLTCKNCQTLVVQIQLEHQNVCEVPLVVRVKESFVTSEKVPESLDYAKLV